MRNYVADPGLQSVMVTERDEDGTKQPFILTAADVKAVERWLPVPRTLFGQPTVMIDDGDVVLRHGITQIRMRRAAWVGFKELVEEIELPLTKIPGDVEVMLDIKASHTHAMDPELLIGNDERFLAGGWDGDGESLDEAITEAVREHDWAAELDDIMNGLDYIEDINTDVSW